MDYKIVWSLINFHFLLSSDMILAFAAVPLVISRKRLFHTEIVETVIDTGSV